MKEQEHRRERLDKRIAELEEELVRLKADRSKENKELANVQDGLEYYRKIFNHMSEGLFVIKNEQLVFSNPALERLLGYSIKELKGFSLSDVIHPDQLRFVQSNYQKRLKGEQLPLYEIKVKTKSRGFRWLRIRAQQIDWQGDDAVLVFSQDVTEELKIKESLEKKEQEIGEIFNDAPLGIFQTTSAGKVIHINNEMANILGFKSQDEALIKYANISHKLYADPKKREEFIQILKEKGEVKNFEYQAITANGVYKWLKMDARISKKNADGSFFIDGFTQDISELKTTSLKLNENERKYRSLIEQSNDAIFILSPEGNHLEVNKKAMELTGYSREEFLNMGYRQLVLPELHEDSKAKLTELNQGLRPKSYEKVFVSKSGEHIPVELTVSPIQDVNDNLKYILSIARDIRERKQAEEESQFLASTALELIHYQNLGDIKQFVADRLYQLLGGQAIITVVDFNHDTGKWKMATTKGIDSKSHKLTELLGFDIRQMEGDILDNKAQLSEGHLIELNDDFESLTKGRIKKNTGKIIKNLLSLDKTYCISIRQNESIYSNITLLIKKKTKKFNKRLIEALVMQTSLFFEKRIAEQALKASEEMFRTLVENQGEGAGIVDENEVFVFANPMAEHLFGVPRGKLVGKSLEHFLDTEAFQLIKEKTKLRRQGKASTYDIDIQQPAGKRISLLLTVTPQFDKNGSFEGSFAVFRDITQLKAAEKALREKETKLLQMNATKDKLFSIIGHDLKNPLSSLLGFTKLLKRKYDSAEKQKALHYIDMIEQSAVSMASLLENILNWSQTQYDVSNVHAEILSIQQVVDDSVKVVKASAENKNIQIIEQLSPSSFVRADGNMIKTVIRNLLSNAIKFTHPGGEIKIETFSSGDMLISKVVDSGIGIPQDRLDSIFHVKSSSSTIGTAGEEGTGLGLIICKEFIEQNMGKIWVEKSDDQGTTFCFSLPAALNTKGSNTNLKGKPFNISIRSNILIVEDDELNYFYLEELLEDLNVTIHHAINGKQALEIIDNNPEIDLVLMDLRMPVMNGYEATRIIKTKRPDLPVIAQSAHTMPEDKKKAQEAGCDGFLEKPINPKQAIEYIRKF